MYDTTKFYLKSGELTRYALTCGYCELWRSDDDRRISVRLEGDGACYHVRVHSIDEGLISWDSFDANELTKARRTFRAKVREYKG